MVTPTSPLADVEEQVSLLIAGGERYDVEFKGEESAADSTIETWSRP